jgi:hypothetical protein
MPIFRGKNIVSAISDYKDSVRTATRSNVDVSANILTIDGISLDDKDRVLLLGQANQSQNGIYTWSTATKKLTRSNDADSIFELSPGNKVYVEEGVSHAKTTWTLITQGIITPGTTGLVFAKEGRVSISDVSGNYGGPGKTLQITTDETGLINSITAIDIELDGGSF